MAADKEIMKAIERLRLDRPGRVYQAADPVGMLGEQLAMALAELATTFREEAELWAKSGAKGWKGSEAENYLVAQHIDDVAALGGNAGEGAAPSVSQREPVGQTEPATTHERLDDFVNSAVAAGKGTLREVPLMDIRPTNGDVAAYLRGDVDTLPGLRAALVPGSVISPPETGNPFEPVPAQRKITLGELLADREIIDTVDGVPVFGPRAVAVEPPCCENMLDAGEDPAPWCDCRSDDDMSRGHAGPCKRQAHTREHHSTPAEKMPTTWESDTMTADGHRLPGFIGTRASGAPTLGQPGDMGTGYSHAYTPAGGRAVTYAELLTPVPAASLPAHLSHSQGNTIGDCGVKYRLQRIEQLPQIPQWANIGGTAFHAAVEALERTIVSRGHPGTPTFEAYDCETTWKHHVEATITAVAATTTVPQSVWRAARKGAEGEQWWRVNGPLMLRRYLDARPDEHTANLPNPSAEGTLGPDMFQSAIELEITADVPTPYGPLPFVAKIDRVTDAPYAEGDNWKTLVIRDYKTSYERPTDTTQVGDYANALRLWGVPESVRILGSYFDARRGEWTTPVDLLQAHPFEAFQYRVTTAHAQKRALTTGPTPARPSSYCGGCSVRYACPVMAAKS